MTDINKRLLAFAMIGAMARENQEQKVTKVKYTASIPIGHRMKKVTGIKEAAYPVKIETIKDLARIEVRNKHNTTIPFEKVEIDRLEILE